MRLYYSRSVSIGIMLKATLLFVICIFLLSFLFVRSRSKPMYRLMKFKSEAYICIGRTFNMVHEELHAWGTLFIVLSYLPCI